MFIGHQLIIIKMLIISNDNRPGLIIGLSLLKTALKHSTRVTVLSYIPPLVSSFSYIMLMKYFWLLTVRVCCLTKTSTWVQPLALGNCYFRFSRQTINKMIDKLIDNLNNYEIFLVVALYNTVPCQTVLSSPHLTSYCITLVRVI